MYLEYVGRNLNDFSSRSELSSGIYCRIKWLSTDVSEVRTASIIRDEWRSLIPDDGGSTVDNNFTRQYNPEDNSEHHTRRRENLKSHDFSSICVQTSSEAHRASCQMGTGGPFPGGKARPGRDVDHSALSSAEVVNEELYILSPQAPPWRVAGLFYFTLRRNYYQHKTLQLHAIGFKIT
jgi:hypothetical protein